MPYRDIERKRAAQREWWARNRIAENSKRYEKREERRKWFQALRQDISCTKCGESHPACIDFHHIDAQNKAKEVSALVTRGWSRRSIEDEMSKCIPLCANCHKKLHAKRDAADAK